MMAVLLAGGLGTRLRPLTERVPKCMVPIQGTPLLGRWIDMLFDNGARTVLINTHHLPEVVRVFIEGHAARKHIELFHEEHLLGTAGTLRAMAVQLRGDSFFVAHADNLAEFDFASFREAHRTRPSHVNMTLLAFESEDPSACGILQCDAQGVVRGFHEKVANPPGRLANGAVYWMDQKVLRFIADEHTHVSDLSTEVLPDFIDRMQAWYDPRTYLRDVGTPLSLALARQEWRVRSMQLAGTLTQA